MANPLRALTTTLREVQHHVKHFTKQMKHLHISQQHRKLQLQRQKKPTHATQRPIKKYHTLHLGDLAKLTKRHGLGSGTQKRFMSSKSSKPPSFLRFKGKIQAQKNETAAVDESAADISKKFGVVKGKLQIGRGMLQAHAQVEVSAAEVNKHSEEASLTDLPIGGKLGSMTASVGFSKVGKTDNATTTSVSVSTETSAVSLGDGDAFLEMAVTRTDARKGKGRRHSLELSASAEFARYFTEEVGPSDEFTQEVEVAQESLQQRRASSAAHIKKAVVEQSTPPGMDHGMDPLSVASILDNILNVQPALADALQHRNKTTNSSFQQPLPEEDILD